MFVVRLCFHYFCGFGGVQLFCASSQEDTAHELNLHVSGGTEEQLLSDRCRSFYISIRDSNMYVEIHMKYQCVSTSNET